MRIRHLSAAVAVALSCALLAVSCVQSPESPPDTDPGAAQSSNGAEPTGEAQQPFGSKAFPFVVDVKDDGEGRGGGWQKAIASLHFVFPISGIHFRCPVVVGMPLRSDREGRISPSRAAFVSAEIATEVGESLGHGRDWQGQGALFCIELREAMRQMFGDRYPGIGAKVTML